jgi:hypothetical protein
LDYNHFFMFLWSGRHKKIQKYFFTNYFLLYLVAIIVIIALYTKKNILIIRCRIYKNWFDIRKSKISQEIRNQIENGVQI